MSTSQLSNRSSWNKLPSMIISSSMRSSFVNKPQITRTCRIWLPRGRSSCKSRRSGNTPWLSSSNAANRKLVTPRTDTSEREYGSLRSWRSVRCRMPSLNWHPRHKYKKSRPWPISYSKEASKKDPNNPFANHHIPTLAHTPRNEPKNSGKRTDSSNNCRMSCRPAKTSWRNWNCFGS
jgi:hypothetical protein